MFLRGLVLLMTCVARHIAPAQGSAKERSLMVVKIHRCVGNDLRNIAYHQSVLDDSPFHVACVTTSRDMLLLL